MTQHFHLHSTDQNIGMWPYRTVGSWVVAGWGGCLLAGWSLCNNSSPHGRGVKTFLVKGQLALPATMNKSWKLFFRKTEL